MSRAWILTVLIAAACGLFYLSVSSPPTTPSSRTYGDVASAATAACAREHPNAPQDWCKRQAAEITMKQFCSDRPWECERKR